MSLSQQQQQQRYLRSQFVSETKAPGPENRLSPDYCRLLNRRLFRMLQHRGYFPLFSLPDGREFDQAIDRDARAAASSSIGVAPPNDPCWSNLLSFVIEHPDTRHVLYVCFLSPLVFAPVSLTQAPQGSSPHPFVNIWSQRDELRRFNLERFAELAAELSSQSPLTLHTVKTANRKIEQSILLLKNSPPAAAADNTNNNNSMKINRKKGGPDSGPDSVLFISPYPSSAFVLKRLGHAAAEYFTELQVLAPVADHYLVGRHRPIADPKERAAILRKYGGASRGASDASTSTNVNAATTTTATTTNTNTTTSTANTSSTNSTTGSFCSPQEELDHLPTLLTTCPVVRYYNFPVGTLLEITQHNRTTLENIYYRVVRRPQQQEKP
jgi:DNA-directed RNA polymerase subunit H (RpoH/RPB5)